MPPDKGPKGGCPWAKKGPDQQGDARNTWDVRLSGVIRSFSAEGDQRADSLAVLFETDEPR